MTIAVESPAKISVGMGQISVTRSPGLLSAVLGSCVGISLYHPRLHVAALSHVVLPNSEGRGNGAAGKFADTAVPAMLEILAKEGVPKAGLIAKIAGGASMFGKPGPLQIGDANVRAVLDMLEKHLLMPVAQDVGGTKGRRVTFDPANGQLLIEVVGDPPRSI